MIKPIRNLEKTVLARMKKIAGKQFSPADALAWRMEGFLQEYNLYGHDRTLEDIAMTLENCGEGDKYKFPYPINNVDPTVWDNFSRYANFMGYKQAEFLKYLVFKDVRDNGDE